ncbi:hypothetical protein RND71_032862 [Anisodus tanguticus]|uniref:Reticulon domain-containing protein n=1 Tax=Anisodus tanguticus TaxID=243964 RepID=A0AAE1UVN1_9SOLA|nr:hypothetical protein RND71_032862 [Anisodus tanguticus]
MQSTSTDSPPPSPTPELGNNSGFPVTLTQSPVKYTTTPELGNNSDIIRDVILWKTKSFSGATLLAATAIWLALEVYGLTFIMLFSWISMFMVAFIFLWGNIHMLLGKEPMDMSRMYISDESVVEAGTKLRGWIEKSVKLLFSVSAEREWIKEWGQVPSHTYYSAISHVLQRHGGEMSHVLQRHLTHITVPRRRDVTRITASWRLEEPAAREEKEKSGVVSNFSLFSLDR